VLTTEEHVDMAESAELLARARNGDADAFCEVAKACEGRLFRQALALCQNPTTTEDLTAETIIEAWKSLGRFDGNCRFSTWLYAILVHRFQKFVRQARSRPVPLAALPAEQAEEWESALERLAGSEPAPGENLEQKELNAQLTQGIESLPEEHQQVVWLRFYGGASLAEIGAALGLPIGTVKSRLHHALKKLRRMQSMVNLSRELGDT
jgi:RNA polymerase sigma-70 factor (ECF subfamily)